jgi:hypothetical protein
MFLYQTVNRVADQEPASIGSNKRGPIEQTLDHLVPNLESGELSIGRLRIYPFLANIADHPFADIVEERGQLVLLTLRHQFNLSVGKIANVAVYLVPFGDRFRGIAEANALDVAAIVDGFS